MSAIVEMKQQEVAQPVGPDQMLMVAVQNGADIDKLERLMALKERYDAAQAKAKFDVAFAAFKDLGANLVSKTKDAHTSKYAPLSEIVKAVTPGLSANGLSSHWDVKDERDWITVTCYLRHVGGHEESVTMGGPIDDNGAKSPIQARASTVTYLQRYTLKAILGVSEEDDDVDGAAVRDFAKDQWVDGLSQVTSISELQTYSRDGKAYFNRVRDRKGLSAFNAAVTAKANEIRGHQ